MVEEHNPHKNDEPYHYPYAVRKDYKKKLDTCLAGIRDGMKVQDAVSMAYGVDKRRWFEWVDMVMEDMEKGITNSPLINAVMKISQGHSNAGRRLTKRANELALDDEAPNVEMLKFLLERNYGFTKTSQQEVAVSAPDEFSFNINITESEKKDDGN